MQRGWAPGHSSSSLAQASLYHCCENPACCLPSHPFLYPELNGDGKGYPLIYWSCVQGYSGPLLGGTKNVPLSYRDTLNTKRQQQAAITSPVEQVAKPESKTEAR